MRLAPRIGACEEISVHSRFRWNEWTPSPSRKARDTAIAGVIAP
jgi:hypothetical protein